eukprot:TRINITY_DN1602_c0_g2_i8.p1 TRINITY_DN1602_c0_g2~~TRINITY_DN1602_c0_g2_i8.p1  ORF type:complete len:946 (+),score=310.11 TRINITY_DN1602_c0_g2_i8:214-2838(+)
MIFTNFQRMIDPMNGNTMAFGFGVQDIVSDYDEECPGDETLPCSEAVMEALIALVARDGCYYDDQSFAVLGSQPLLRPSGGMGLVVWESDGNIAYNSMDPTISGLSIDEWQTKWDFSTVKYAFYTQTKYTDDHRRKTPFHMEMKLSEDGPLEPVAALMEQILLEKTELTVMAFHRIKPKEEYTDNRYEESSSSVDEDNVVDDEPTIPEKFIPDPCPSFFENSCSYEYGEYLVSKVYEGLVSTYFKGLNGTAFSTWSNPFDDYVMELSLTNKLKDTILPSLPIRDFNVYIMDTESLIIGVIKDDFEKYSTTKYYGREHNTAYPVGTNMVEDVLEKSGKITTFNERYEPNVGIPGDEFMTSLMGYGTLANPKDRWLDVIISLFTVKDLERKYHVKTVVIENSTYLIVIDASGQETNTKCSVGCPTHSHCAPDGMFCICDDAAVWPDKTIFECKPKYILEDPPTIRMYFYGTFAFCFIIALMVSLLLFINRKTRLMRLSSHTITQIVVLGVLMLYLGALSFALPPVDYPSVCWQRPLWTIGGASIALLALFLKTWRIQRLFNNSKMKRMKLDNSVLVRYMLIVMVPIVIFLILWIGVMYPDFGYYSPDELEYENPQYGICTERNELAAVVGIYLVCIIIWGGYNAQKSQNVPTGANESGAILKTLLLFFMSGAIFVPLNYMVDDSNQSLMLVIRAFGALVCGGSVLIAIVGQKTIWLIRGEGDADFIIQTENGGTHALNKHRYRRSSQNNSTGAYSTALGNVTNCDSSTSRPFKSTLSSDINNSVNGTYASRNVIKRGNTNMFVKRTSNCGTGGGMRVAPTSPKKGWDIMQESDHDSESVSSSSNRGRTETQTNQHDFIVTATTHVRNIRGGSAGSQ